MIKDQVDQFWNVLNLAGISPNLKIGLYFTH